MAHINFMPAPTVEPRPAPPPDYQEIATNPREFGAQVGEGEERLGAGVTEAGKLYGEIAADDQANHVLGGIDDLNAKFRALQGKDRMDQYPVLRQQMQGLLDGARNNLSTAEQVVSFNRQTRELYSRAQREAGDLYDQAQKTWGIGVNEHAANLSLNGIARGTADNDAGAIANHTEDLINARMKSAQLQFGNQLTPDIRQDIIRGARADATTTSVESLITTDPVRAQQILDAGRDNLLGNDYEALSQRLRQPIIDHQAQQLVFGSTRPAGNPTISTSQVTQIAQANGVDPALANATAAIESGHGANVGTRGDIYQMGPNERATVGGGPAPAGTPDQQAQQGVQFLAQKRKELQLALGRDPSNDEIYLAHQQGTAGAVALLKAANDPNNAIPAGDIVGKAAIRSNGGDPNAPASQFVQMWQDRYRRAEQQYSQGAPPYAYPSDRMRQIMQSDAQPQAKEAAARLLELDWVAQNHAYEQQRQQATASSQAREAEIMTSLSKGQPIMTPQQALGDNALLPDARLRMANFLATGAFPKVSPAASQHESMALLDDMRKPAGDPTRVSDMNPIVDAYTQGKLTREDFSFLQTQFNNVRAPDGDKLASVERDFLKGMQSSITKSNPLMGQLDREGDRKLYEFNWMVSQRVAQARREGKNPFDLFDPAKPDYLGKPEALRPYQTTTQQSSQSIADALSQQGTAVPIPPAAPTALPRQPGESIADYMKRAGIAMPTMPAPAMAAPAGPAAPIARP